MIMSDNRNDENDFFLRWCLSNKKLDPNYMIGPHCRLGFGHLSESPHHVFRIGLYKTAAQWLGVRSA